jgi:hypothetical protein
MEIIVNQKDTGVVLEIHDAHKLSKEELINLLEATKKEINKGIRSKYLETIEI